MVDYNDFAKTFSDSRKNMKWEEIDYFLDILNFSESTKILDIWCGNGRFLSALKDKFPNLMQDQYIWIDLSSGLLEEAKKLHPDFAESFSELNMLEIDTIRESFSGIFFIASFHHLPDYFLRLEVLQKAKQLLVPGGKIYMTNWALDSELNYKKYKNSIIETTDWTDIKFWSSDYNIKIWDHERYYHCSSLDELNILAIEAGIGLQENRLFDNYRNIISIFLR